ncbi:hypothetical protein Ocin01_10371 [Orchesella cincta]|uniref:Uncharacterized protein n=1 Tax=Orchesella cincta TaxID=48709 RepID=A0A1D2MU32_ORCCI|nr:hypothetical protein Ocin01_10371 [Orchesella cincta]
MCPQGLVLPLNPVDVKSEWKCKHCLSDKTLASKSLGVEFGSNSILSQQSSLFAYFEQNSWKDFFGIATDVLEDFEWCWHWKFSLARGRALIF